MVYLYWIALSVVIIVIFIPGSYDNLHARSTSSTQTRDLTLTGHRVDFSPTSPESPSPRSPRKSSPGKGPPFAPDTPQQIDLGMTVLVSRNRGKLSRGIVRYVGYLPDKQRQVYIGLELGDAGNFLKVELYVLHHIPIIIKVY